MQKLVPDLFLILVNNPKQSLHARNSLEERYFERGLPKSLQVNFIFSFEPSLFKWKNYQKQKGPGTSNQ